MALATGTQSTNGSIPPYWERIEPVVSELVGDQQVRVFDDREEGGRIHVQVSTNAGRRKVVTLKFDSKAEFAELHKDLGAVLKALP